MTPLCRLAVYLGLGLGCDMPILEAVRWALVDETPYTAEVDACYSPYSPSYTQPTPEEEAQKRKNTLYRYWHSGHVDYELERYWAGVEVEIKVI